MVDLSECVGILAYWYVFWLTLIIEPVHAGICWNITRNKQRPRRTESWPGSPGLGGTDIDRRAGAMSFVPPGQRPVKSGLHPEGLAVLHLVLWEVRWQLRLFSPMNHWMIEWSIFWTQVWSNYSQVASSSFFQFCSRSCNVRDWLPLSSASHDQKLCSTARWNSWTRMRTSSSLANIGLSQGLQHLGPTVTNFVCGIAI